jgi:DeoR/GlpR family transcriptional regulator of sugar metabolism
VSRATISRDLVDLCTVHNSKPAKTATQLGVSQATISGDLANLSTADKSKSAKTASNPKGSDIPCARLIGFKRPISSDDARRKTEFVFAT